MHEGSKKVFNHRNAIITIDYFWKGCTHLRNCSFYVMIVCVWFLWGKGNKSQLTSMKEHNCKKIPDSPRHNQQAFLDDLNNVNLIPNLNWLYAKRKRNKGREENSLKIEKISITKLRKIFILTYIMEQCLISVWWKLSSKCYRSWYLHTFAHFISDWILMTVKVRCHYC